MNCEPCKLNINNWLKLTDITNQDNVNIIGISIDSLQETRKYFSNVDINFPVYSAFDDEFKIDYKGYITPQTILINENGKITKSWSGILNIYLVSEILNKVKDK